MTSSIPLVWYRVIERSPHGCWSKSGFGLNHRVSIELLKHVSSRLLFFCKISPPMKEFVLVSYRDVRMRIQERRNESVTASRITNKQNKNSHVITCCTRRLFRHLLGVSNDSSVFVDLPPLQLSIPFQALRLSHYDPITNQASARRMTYCRQVARAQQEKKSQKQQYGQEFSQETESFLCTHVTETQGGCSMHSRWSEGDQTRDCLETHRVLSVDVCCGVFYSDRLRKLTRDGSSGPFLRWKTPQLTFQRCTDVQTAPLPRRSGVLHVLWAGATTRATTCALSGCLVQWSSNKESLPEQLTAGLCCPYSRLVSVWPAEKGTRLIRGCVRFANSNHSGILGILE